MKRLLIILLFISAKSFANITIWLDFKGGVVRNTSWNTTYTAGAQIIYAPATFANDADSVAFVRNGVAEAYSGFNITVTTDSTVYFATPAINRTKIIYTRSYQWYGSSEAGRSNTGSMYNGDDTPGWGFQIANVFGDPQYNLKTITDVCIHEAGHTMGLSHQGKWTDDCVTLLEQYRTGSGTGQTAVGPIMGNPYSKNMSIWWSGTKDYNCLSTQDDIKILAEGYGTNVGPGYVLDDVGSGWETAKVLQKNIPAYRLLGNHDNDFYKIIIPATTTVTITAVPFSQGANNLYAKVDLAIDILKEDLSPVASSNNTTTLDASIVTILRAGVYYVKVRPDTSNTNNPTGYGFIGHYTLNMNY